MMLQNGTPQAIDPIILGAIIGIGGIVLGFVLRYIVDNRTEQNRKQDEYIKFIHIIYIELISNAGRLEGNIGSLKEQAEPIIYLKDELWKAAVNSGFLRYLSQDVYAELIKIYNGIDIFNQQIKYRERLPDKEIDAIKEMGNKFIKSFGELQEDIMAMIRILKEKLEKVRKF